MKNIYSYGYEHTTISRGRLTQNARESQSYTVYSDNSQKVDLFVREGKFYALLSTNGEEPREINVKLPNYFNSIPSDKIEVALSRHGKHLIKTDLQTVSSIRISGQLLGAGPVSSKILNSRPLSITHYKRRVVDNTHSVNFENQIRIEELTSQISDTNQVIDEWRSMYETLKKEKKSHIIEKTIEVPVEVVTFVENPTIVEKEDTRLEELQTQIDIYEKRMYTWRRKFTELNDTVTQEHTVTDIEDTFDHTLIMTQENEPDDIEVEDAEDSKKLKTIRDKIKSLSKFSRELQRKCVSIESRVTEKTTQIDVEVIKYVDRPVESVVYDNAIVDVLKEKVEKLRENLRGWQDKYQTETDNFAITVDHTRVERVSTQNLEFPEFIEEEDDSSLVKMKDELQLLRDTLSSWQEKLSSNEEIIERIIEVPVEVVRYVERPIEVIKNDESKALEIQKQISEIFASVQEWKGKFKEMSIKTNIQSARPTPRTVQVENTQEHVENPRVIELKEKMEDLKTNLQYWEEVYHQVADQEPTIVNKITEVKVPVIKYLEKPVEVIVNDDTKVNELKLKIVQMSEKLTLLREKAAPTKEKKNAKVIEKIIEVPVETIKYVDRKVEKVQVDNARILELTEQLNALSETAANWQMKCNSLAVKGVELVERIVEIPVETVKYVDKPVVVIKVDEARLAQVQREYNALKQNYGTWTAKYNDLQQREVRIVEKIVEVQKEVIQYIDKPVEVLVVDQRKLEDLNTQHLKLVADLKALKSIKKPKQKVRVVDKIVEVGVERIEHIEQIVEILEVDFEKIKALEEEVETLTGILDEWHAKYEAIETKEPKIVERLVEVPIEVIEYIDKPIEIKKTDQAKVNILQQEHDRLVGEIETVRRQTKAVKQPRVIQKIVDVEVEKIVYVDKIVEVVKVDEEKVNELTMQLDGLVCSLNNWKVRMTRLEEKTVQQVERIVENPIETIEYIIDEVIVKKVDEKRMKELTREYQKLTDTIDNLKEQCMKLQQRPPKIVEKTQEVIVETIQYIDKSVETLVVDEELLAKLKKEIGELSIKYDEITLKVQEAAKTETKIVEKRVEVEREIQELVEYNLEITQIDDSQVVDLQQQIDQLNDSIKLWQDKYSAIQERVPKIKISYQEVPVEVIEFNDNEVEVLHIDEDHIDLYKKQYEIYAKELKSIEAEIRLVEADEGHVVDRIKKVPKEVQHQLEREVETYRVDEKKINKLTAELDMVNHKLSTCLDQIKDLESAEIKIVERIVDVPYEKIVYVDKEVENVQEDRERINVLKKRIKEIEAEIKTKKPELKKAVSAQVREKFVDAPFTTTKNIERTVEIHKLDQEHYNELIAQYNEMEKELAQWKVKCLEIENVVPKIVERTVEVPVERIEYRDKVVEVVKVDEVRIEELKRELDAIVQANAFWQSKVDSIKTERCVVETFVDVPVETIEYVDRVIEKVIVDEERIKDLEAQLEEYTSQLTVVKNQFKMNSKAEPVIIERIIEIPVEVIVEVEKIVEIVRVDQEQLNELTAELNRITEKCLITEVQIEESEEFIATLQDTYVDVIVEKIEYVDVIVEEIKEDEEKIRDLETQLIELKGMNPVKAKKQKYVKLPPTIVERTMNVPYEVIEYVDNEVEVIKRDKLREKELKSQIELAESTITTLQEQFERMEKANTQVIRKVVEVPVEVIEYIDNPVEVIQYDESAITDLERDIIFLRGELAKLLDDWDESKAFEEGSKSEQYIKAEIPKPKALKTFDPVCPNDDDERLVNISEEIKSINNLLLSTSEEFMRLETTESQIVERIVEVPVEVIRYIDKPYEVYRNDDARVNELEFEISKIQNCIDEYSKTNIDIEEDTRDVIQQVHPIMGHANRPKEVHREERNVTILEEQIGEIYNNAKIWKNKYLELNKRSPKVVERIVEIPVEVIKYVDKRVETIRKDDERVQTLEKELATLTTQFQSWQLIFSEDDSTAPSIPKKLKSMAAFDTVTRVEKPSQEYLDILAKVSKFTNDFQNLRKNIDDLDKMEKIIVGRIVEVPKEVAHIIDQKVETMDHRPKELLRDLELMNARLGAWSKGIDSKVVSGSDQVIEKKITKNENMVDNTPFFKRDNTAEKELEEDLLEITNLVTEFEQRIAEIEEEKEEVIVNTRNIKIEIERIVHRDTEVLLKDIGHETFLLELIAEAEKTISNYKKEYKGKKGQANEIIERIVEIKKEVIKTVTRNTEILKYDNSEIETIEAKYTNLASKLDSLIQNCSELELSEFDIVEKVIKVPREIVRTVERKIKVAKIDERPILEMVEKLNAVNLEINAATKPEESPLEEEIIEREVTVEREIIRYEIVKKEVKILDTQQASDLEERITQLKQRIKVWKGKCKAKSNEEVRIIEKIIEVPVKKVKTIYKLYGEVQYEANSLVTLAHQVNELADELKDKKSELLSASNVPDEVVTIFRDVEVISKKENIITRIVWDETPINELNKKITKATKKNSQMEVQFLALEEQKKEVEEVIKKVDILVKKYEIKTVQTVVIDESPVNLLQDQVNAIKVSVEPWNQRLLVLKSEKVPVVETINEVEREKYIKKKRIIETTKFDEKPIQLAIQKIDSLNKQIDIASAKLVKAESNKVKIVEKIVKVPKDVTVYVAKRNEQVNVKQCDVNVLIELKARLAKDLEEWKVKAATAEQDKPKTIKKIVQVPKKVIKPIDRDIEVPTYDSTELKEWEEKCNAMRLQIQKTTEQKLAVSRLHSKVIERETIKEFEVITYVDEIIPIDKWDDVPAKNLEAEILVIKGHLAKAEAKRKDFKTQKNNVVEQIVKRPKEVIKKVERVVEKTIWNDEKVHSYEEKLKEVIERFNERANEIVVDVDDEDVIIDKITKIPREIINYVETVKEVVVFDDEPIAFINNQIIAIKKEIKECRQKCKKPEERIVIKNVEKEVEYVNIMENLIENYIYDDAKINKYIKKIKNARAQQDDLREQYKTKRSPVVVEETIQVMRNVVKKIDRVSTVEIEDNTRAKELQLKIKEIKADFKALKAELKTTEKKESVVIVRDREVEVEVKIYKEKIVEKIVLDDTLLKEMTNKIRTAEIKLRMTKPKKQIVKVTRPEVRVNKIERKVEQIRKVERPIKVIKYDDTNINKLEKKIRKYQKSYVAPTEEVEIIEEAGDIIEKIIEVPVKQIRTVQREFEKIIWDDSRIKKYQAALIDREFLASEYITKIQMIMEKRNIVREEIEERKVEVRKYVKRNIEIVKYQKSSTDNLERDLEQVKRTLELVIEQYKNLKSADREIVVRTVEVPYETIKYIGVEVVVNKVDAQKVNKLELKLQNLRDMEEEIKEHQLSIQTQKRTPIERTKTVQKEQITYIDRPIRTLKIKNEKLEELDMQLREAQSELSNWKTQCEDYDIVKERIIEVPVEKIVEVDYEVEVRKVDDALVKELAQSVCDIKNALYDLENVHDNLIEKKSQIIEKIVEVPKNVVKYVDREINVIKFDPERVGLIEKQIKSLKKGLSAGRKDFVKFEQKKNIVEKRVEVEQEVVKYIDRPVDLTSFNRTTMREINTKLNTAYSAFAQWQDKFRLLREEKYTPEEKVIEVEVERKKFAINRTDILKTDDEEIALLEHQMNLMKQGISEFKDKVTVVQKNLKKKIVKETIMEVAREKLVYVEVPTHIMQIDTKSQKELKTELKKLRTAATSALKTKL